jgi:capsular exopolysaccharide synthesis family protein
LSEHYGPRHPLVVELQQSIDNTQQYLDNFQTNVSQRATDLNNETLGPALLNIVKEKLAGVHAYEAELTRHYQEVEAEAIRLNDRFMEVSLLQHDLDRLRQLHDTLLNQIANLDIRQNQADVRIAMVDEPQVDLRPVSPQLKMVVLFCLLGGCGAGAVLAYVIDLLDDRFRSPDELREELGAPVLAVIHALGSIGEGDEAVADPSSVEMEAFRTLRTTLAFAGDERNRLVVTSSEPGDGKTTVISHLAAACGLAGRRTLLIDADMRKPGLSRLFRLRGRPGLSDVLRSHEDLDPLCAARIVATGMDGVDVLPCGPKPGDPLELLGRARFEELLGWAEARYDQVLIDTPPVLAASDSAVAGRLVDGVMLVVQPGKNSRRIILRAVDELQLMRVPLVGIVVNRVDADADDGYDGYGYGYGYGYGEDEAEEEDDDPIIFRRAAA